MFSVAYKLRNLSLCFYNYSEGLFAHSYVEYISEKRVNIFFDTICVLLYVSFIFQSRSHCIICTCLVCVCMRKTKCTLHKKIKKIFFNFLLVWFGWFPHTIAFVRFFFVAQRFLFLCQYLKS